MSEGCSLPWPGPEGGTGCTGPKACSRATPCCLSACCGGPGEQPVPVSARLWAIPCPGQGPLPLSIGDGSVMGLSSQRERGHHCDHKPLPRPGQQDRTQPHAEGHLPGHPVLTIKNAGAMAWAWWQLRSKHPLRPAWDSPTPHPAHGPPLRPAQADRRAEISASRSHPLKTPHHLGTNLVHFSENPILYLLLPLIFVNKCSFGCKVELEY